MSTERHGRQLSEPMDHPNRPVAVSESNEVLIVTGSLRLEERRLDFRPARILPATGNAPDVRSGPFRVEVTGIDGEMLAVTDFDVDRIADSDEPTADFSVALAIPNMLISTITVFHEGAELGMLKGSDTRPSVTIDYPSSGQTAIAGGSEFMWTGTHPNGGDLYYTVLLSADNGESWSGILSSSDKTSVRPSSRSMTATEEAVLLVSVSDGVNGSFVYSPPFVIE